VPISGQLINATPPIMFRRWAPAVGGSRRRAEALKTAMNWLGVHFASTRGCAMHLLLSRSGARANADADRYWRQLDSILAVARRRELESPAPDRRPLPDDCPSTGEGFVWQANDAVPAPPPRRTTNRRLAHVYWRPILFLIIVSLCIASTWETGAATRPGTNSHPVLSTGS
jgi:hypothetical protein